MQSTLHHAKHAAAMGSVGMPSRKIWIFTCSEMESDGSLATFNNRIFAFTIQLHSACIVSHQLYS